MATLNDLPYENIVEILSSLSSLDLARMSCVSHHFHSISMILLYKTPCLAKTPGLRVNPPSLGLFIRTLVTPGREILATDIRSLCWYQEGSQANHTFLSEGDTALVAAAPNRLNLGQLPRTESAQFLLLLHLIPCLQVLTIYPARDYSLNTFFMKLSSVLSSATPTLPMPLQSLREFCCLDDAIIDSMHSMMLLTLMSLPCITSIDVRAIESPSPSASTQLSGAAGISPLTKLRLTNSMLILSTLSLVLAVPRALTHFAYSVPAGEFYNVTGFTDSLRPMQNTLQYLQLDFSGTVREGYSPPRRLPCQLMTGFRPYYPHGFTGGSLCGWNALRTLSCSLSPLLGNWMAGRLLRLVDVLPGGIRELEILEDCYWTYGNAVDQVVELLGLKEVAVPVLERLAVVNTGDGGLEAKEMLSAACISAGVTLVEDSFCW